MTKYLLIFIISFIGFSAVGQSYRFNDTMFIWEMHGVDVIIHPEMENQVMSKQYYGTSVRVVDTDLRKFPVKKEVNQGLDLQGHWVKVIIDRDTGYVFDGYLSHLKPFDLRSDEKGIALMQHNFKTDGAVSKGIRSFDKGQLDEGKSRSIRFDNGISWNIKNIQNCLLETYTYQDARLAEAYQLMMVVYSNYFDQNATYMSEPEFVRMNGNKYEFIIRGGQNKRRITIYKKEDNYIISSYTCP